MELTDLPMFGLMRRKLAWLNQRQEVIAQNLANADTPKYASHDIQAFNFKDELNHVSHSSQWQMLATDPRHYTNAGGRAGEPFKDTEERNPYETAPNGNQVVLEEQMVKMNETQADHNMMTQLYKKHLNMFKLVTRSGGGG
jgi:flagellar basal-body rod protein FlgB